MNRKQLIYFLKTAELKSIAAASRVLGIAQPGVSQQIANLEHHLGVDLFERDFRGVHLTESGLQFRDHAEAILRLMDQSKREVQHSASQPEGLLKIGMTQPIGNLLAVPLLEALKESYPGITLDFYTGLSYELVEQLKAQKIDLAITSPDDTDTSGVKQELLFTEQIFLIVGRQSKKAEFQSLLNRKTITFKELAHYRVMITNKNDSLGYLLTQLEQEQGVTIERDIPLGQLLACLRYVADGFGLLVAPTSAYYHLKRQNHLVHDLEIVEPAVFREVFYSTLMGRPVTNVQRVVKNVLKTVIQRMYDEGAWVGRMPEM